jgi:hypothetical protein
MVYGPECEVGLPTDQPNAAESAHNTPSKCEGQLEDKIINFVPVVGQWLMAVQNCAGPMSIMDRVLGFAGRDLGISRLALSSTCRLLFTMTRGRHLPSHWSPGHERWRWGAP